MVVGGSWVAWGPGSGWCLRTRCCALVTAARLGRKLSRDGRGALVLREEVLESRGAMVGCTSEGNLEMRWSSGAVSGTAKRTWRALARVLLLAVNEDEGESTGACATVFVPTQSTNMVQAVPMVPGWWWRRC